MSANARLGAWLISFEKNRRNNRDSLACTYIYTPTGFSETHSYIFLAGAYQKLSSKVNETGKRKPPILPVFQSVISQQAINNAVGVPFIFTEPDAQYWSESRFPWSATGSKDPVSSADRAGNQDLGPGEIRGQPTGEEHPFYKRFKKRFTKFNPLENAKNNISEKSRDFLGMQMKRLSPEAWSRMYNLQYGKSLEGKHLSTIKEVETTSKGLPGDPLASVISKPRITYSQLVRNSPGFSTNITARNLERKAELVIATQLQKHNSLGSRAAIARTVAENGRAMQLINRVYQHGFRAQPTHAQKFLWIPQGGPVAPQNDIWISHRRNEEHITPRAVAEAGVFRSFMPRNKMWSIVQKPSEKYVKYGVGHGEGLDNQEFI